MFSATNDEAVPTDMEIHMLTFLTTFEINLVIKRVCRYARLLTMQLPEEQPKYCTGRHRILRHLSTCTCWTATGLRLFCMTLSAAETHPLRILPRINMLKDTMQQITGRDLYLHSDNTLRLWVQRRKSLSWCNSVYYTVVFSNLISKYSSVDPDRIQHRLLMLLYTRFAIMNETPRLRDWVQLIHEKHF